MSSPTLGPSITPADLKALKDAGFIQPSPQPSKPPRISVATRGKTKRGKTHWAIFTPPDPIAVISLDTGTRQIVDKAVAQGRVVMPFYIDHSRRDDQAQAKKSWQDYRKALSVIRASRSIRTLVIDTISDAWDLIQLAEFGKLKQNNKFAYGGINAEFPGLVEEFYHANPSINTVYIQKLKKQYTGDNWDGKSMQAVGFNGFDYLVDLSITHIFEGGKFGFETDASEATRFGPEFSGLKFMDGECSFVDLAMNIFSDEEKCKRLGFGSQGADPEYWGVR